MGSLGERDTGPRETRAIHGVGTLVFVWARAEDDVDLTTRNGGKLVALCPALEVGI
jgi:hypothetical protein